MPTKLLIFLIKLNFLISTFSEKSHEYPGGILGKNGVIFCRVKNFNIKYRSPI